MKLLISNDIYQNLFFFVIIALIITWCTTQGFKILLKIYLGEKFHFGMLFSSGDFPSTHTAIIISSLCLVIFLTFNVKEQDLTIWRAYTDIKSILIMTIFVCITLKNTIGQRQDNTNKNLKNLKDFITNSKEPLNRKNIITDVITDTFESIDNEAFKKAGQLKHELVGGLLSGFLGASYTICIFFDYLKFLPGLIIISVLYFFGMGIFLKLKPILKKLYTDFK